jgi:ribosome biogenesis SPOUT family RNA methylase Rps3
MMIITQIQDVCNKNYIQVGGMFGDHPLIARTVGVTENMECLLNL